MIDANHGQHPETEGGDGAVREGVVTLSGGRRLGYTEYGAPAGRPVLFFHGLPGTGGQARGLHQAATAVGARVVAPDRPGMGRSDFAARRRITDWPADVLALTDALGVDRFAVMGISGGGPYAACCAHAMPDRLAGVAITSGLAPLDSHTSLDGLNEQQRTQRAGMLTMRRLPGLSRLAALAMARQTRKPGGGLGLATQSFGPVDQQRIERSPDLRRRVDQTMTDAFGQGSRGVGWDMRLAVTPWGFDPSTITVPVHLWHGELDNNVPVTDGRRLAATIPDCRAVFCPDQGHLLFLDRAEDILRALTATV